MFRSLLLSLTLSLSFACAPTAYGQESRRIAVPVFELPAAQGDWAKLTNAVSSGRVYDFAVAMDTLDTSDYMRESRVVFANPGGFDSLETWVGVAQRPHNGEIRFSIAGDGATLYRSPWMTWRDRAEKVRVSIKGYKGISLIVEGYRVNKFNMAIWGEPVLVQTGPPQLTESPRRFPSLMTVRQSGSGIGVFVGGAPVEFGSAKPINEGSGLLVPIRPIMEAMGARIQYDAASRQMVAMRGDQVIVMTVGAKSATLNGRQIELDAPIRVLNGETMVPLRFVAESLGVPVEYQR